MREGNPEWRNGGWLAQRDFLGGERRVDVDGELAADLSPALDLGRPRAQLEAETVGAELHDERLRRRLVGHERMLGGDALEQLDDVSGIGALRDGDRQLDRALAARQR